MAQQKTTIDDLPDEVLVMIVGLLPTVEDIIQCSMVSHRWHRLTAEETLWRSATISEFTVIPLRSLAKLIQRGIRKLDLSNVVIADPDSWSRIFSPPTYRSPMTFLDMTDAGISVKAFESLLKPMNQLQELRLGSCTCRLNRECCAAIARNKQLRILDLSCCRAIDTRGLGKILGNCQRLEDLNLSETNLNRHSLNLIAQTLPASLLRLNLRNLGLLFADEHLAKVVQLCPNLTHLDISENRFLSHSAVEVTAALRNLEELKNEQIAVDSDEDYDTEDSIESDFDLNSSESSDDSDDSINVPLGVLLNEDDLNNSSSDSSFCLGPFHVGDLDLDSSGSLSESSPSESSGDD